MKKKKSCPSAAVNLGHLKQMFLLNFKSFCDVKAIKKGFYKNVISIHVCSVSYRASPLVVMGSQTINGLGNMGVSLAPW